jgi:hypothetical protein
MSFRWRRPADEIKRALDFIMSDKVGWIIDLDSSARLVPAECPSGALKEGRKEGRKEEKVKPPSGGVLPVTPPRQNPTSLPPMNTAEIRARSKKLHDEIQNTPIPPMPMVKP